MLMNVNCPCQINQFKMVLHITLWTHYIVDSLYAYDLSCIGRLTILSDGWLD